MAGNPSSHGEQMAGEGVDFYMTEDEKCKIHPMFHFKGAFLLTKPACTRQYNNRCVLYGH